MKVTLVALVALGGILFKSEGNMRKYCHKCKGNLPDKIATKLWNNESGDGRKLKTMEALEAPG